MELKMKDIHINGIKSNSKSGFTIDDDIIVSDSKPDVERIIKDQGEVSIQDIKILKDKINIKGILEFTVLYFGGSGEIGSISGKINFDENINAQDIDSKDMINIKCELEDMTATIINSRKISIRALVNINCVYEEENNEDIAVDIDYFDDDKVSILKEKANISQIVVNQKDVLRINDDIVLSSMKKDIEEIVYYDMALVNMDYRLMDNAVGIKGGMNVFVLYITKEGDFDYIEKEIPINSSIDVNGCNPVMVDNIRTAINERLIQIKKDEDGEERIFEIDAALDIEIKIYVEEEVDILKDVYSIKYDVKLDTKKVEYECLKLKNNSKFKINDRMKLDDSLPEVLQICDNNAKVYIDDVIAKENGMDINGVVSVQTLYISEDDMQPLNLIKLTIPYNSFIEVKNLDSNCVYDITPNLDSINITMLGNREIEVKCIISLFVIVFEKKETEVIKSMSVSEPDIEKIEDLPAMTGYVVKENDSLWKIAKEFHSTIEKIKKVNDLENNDVNVNERLLVLKEV